MNTWTCENCGRDFKTNGDWPDKCPKCGKNENDQAGGFSAKYPASRINYKRATYRYYTQSTDWARAANAAMKDAANAAFNNR